MTVYFSLEDMALISTESDCQMSVKSDCYRFLEV